MKKFFIAFVCTGTIYAFNPKSPEHVHVRRLLGERKISKEQFFGILRHLNEAHGNQQITNFMVQERIRTTIEKS